MGKYKDSEGFGDEESDDVELSPIMKWSEKTLKRELAIAAQVLWWGLVLFGVFGKSVEAAEAATNMQIVVWAYTGAAFGLDAYAKQIAMRR